MSVFGRATFSAARYAGARPGYPASLFLRILAYHGDQNPKRALLDLGCGHGAVARELSPHFNTVIGLDPSANMVKQARDMTPRDCRVTFRRGNTEDLYFLADASLDMAVAGQSTHWFDYSKAWPELARVMRPGGTLAFWGYEDIVLLGHARANEILDRFCYAQAEVEPGVEGMRAYWEQSGRSILRNLLREVKPPTAEWEDVQRELYDVAMDATQCPDAEKAWMRKRINLGQLEAYREDIQLPPGLAGCPSRGAQQSGRRGGGRGRHLDGSHRRVRAAVGSARAGLEGGGSRCVGNLYTPGEKEVRGSRLTSVVLCAALRSDD